MAKRMPTRDSRRRRVAAVALLLCALAATAQAQPYQPVKWTQFVTVEGQSEPIPQQWLATEEGRFAHNLKLPAVVPPTVPFELDNGTVGSWLDALFTRRAKAKAAAYFQHLCKTEAGEWIVKTVDNIDGLYLARPRGDVPATSDLMGDRYGPEMPWIQRAFLLRRDDLTWEGRRFVYPPFSNYLFVEQPKRPVPWQAHIQEPYVRLFGYTTRPALDQNGKPTEFLSDNTPMQVEGVNKLASRYGYTWRGIRRKQDREHGIAGGELLIYELATKEVIAVRRQFLITFGNRITGEKAAWEIAGYCAPPRPVDWAIEFDEFPLNVLKTIEPSRRRGK